MTENPEKITPAKKAFYAFLSVLAIVLLLVGWMLIARVRPYLFPSPVAVWQRFLLILEKPTGRYPLYIHIPVSYTHLDVYKRQTGDRPRARWSEPSNLSGTIS